MLKSNIKTVPYIVLVFLFIGIGCGSDKKNKSITQSEVNGIKKEAPANQLNSHFDVEKEENIKSVFSKINFEESNNQEICFTVDEKRICINTDNGAKFDNGYNKGYVLAHSDNVSQISNFEFYEFNFDENTINILGEIIDQTATNYTISSVREFLMLHPAYFLEPNLNSLEVNIYNIFEGTLEKLQLPNNSFEVIKKVEVIEEEKVFIESQTLGNNGVIKSIIYENKDEKYEEIFSHISHQVSENNLDNSVFELLDAINNRNLSKILGMVSSDFYYSRDFGGLWNGELSYQQNFVNILQLDNENLKPEYFDSGWYKLKFILMTSKFEKNSETNEYCSKEITKEVDGYTYISSRICFKNVGGNQYLISGYIGGGD